VEGLIFSGSGARIQAFRCLDRVGGAGGGAMARHMKGGRDVFSGAGGDLASKKGAFRREEN